MSNKITIKINNKTFSANPGETILDVALREKIEIPHLCKHPDLSVKANCRVCVVEVKELGIVTSCSTQVEDGMEIKTNSEKVKNIRKTNLELIFGDHLEKCPTCLYQDKCTLLDYGKKYVGMEKDNITVYSSFSERKKDYPKWQFADSIQYDSSKCIECRNCVEVCQVKQAVDFYEVSKDKGIDVVVKPKDDTAHDKKFDCVYCGQCITHCPVGAISGVPHWDKVEKLLEDKKNKLNNKILVAQIAPSIRVSIGEEFGMKTGKIVTGQLVSSIKKLGFDYAFDINLGADITTFEEAKELVHWLKNKKDKPMFTSCCPAWVEFVKFYYPDFISHLTTTDSPHICSGTVTKTFFADLIKKDPRDIVVVSILPCTAKKHEVNLETHQIDLGECLERLELKNIEKVCKNRKELIGTKIPAVDYALTTREYAYLLKRHKIDLSKLKPQDSDQPLGTYSGAGAIYGASGGVMESALRTAEYLLAKDKNKKINNSRIDFKEVRGQQGIKQAKVKLAGQKLNVAVANGLANAKIILENIKSGKAKYDYVEIMACPGGCIGGGGQPIPVSDEIREQRANALYEIDKNLPIRKAHENPNLQEIYNKYFQDDEQIAENLLHSKKKKKIREGYFEVK